ncbi:uncharacterized protein LOC107619154 [Arachis ipaensis]|uniref:Uncharacterized protein n=1 Tax=Arachis hypogaea TaxID=3818 RepID=A0A444XLR1_ARAHY|nr:uncharacterized protein LOC107619154 [Arachis ipaensis]RYQ90546.1 hypothetical protein Ahy_B09g096599 [Arachis hypogaea]
MMFIEGLDDTAIQWIKQGSQVEDSKPEPDAPTWSPLSERRIVSDRFLRSPVLDSPILPPLKFYTALLTPQNIAFSFGDDTDESTVSLPDDADSSDEELSAPSNLDYLERPISHCYDEDELFGCKLLKPQRSNGVLKKGLANQNLTLQLSNTLGV